MPFGFNGGFSVNAGANIGANFNVSAGANVNLNAGVNLAVNNGNSPGQRVVDPYLVHNFKVEFLGLTAGGFSEVSGLSIQVEVERKTFGGQHNIEYKFVKGIRYPDLVLKRGIGDIDLLWAWYLMVLNGTIIRQNGSIVLFDQAKNRVRQWDFEGAYPIKWEGPVFNATSNTVAIESLTLVHHGLKMVF